ncbi:uncharacterized protein [Chelonus insularis]|nr:uncharacterized protein LOC118069587 isoform X2 [Chelonus insularis]
MAKKNVPAALQIEVNNDEEWAKFLEKKGLLVVDVYSDWSGPCTGMVSILKKIKMEIGGDLLVYATAKCDNIADLARFRGKSEPTWMFIQDSKMVNLMFGAYCPELQKMLTDEIHRVQNNEPPIFSIPVSEPSPEEQKRLQILEEERLAKEAAKKAQKEALIKSRYEAEINHFTESLKDQTCLILYPWVFKDEEGHRRDKKSSPPYIDLIENILPNNFTVEQELRKNLNEELIMEILNESGWEIDKNVQEIMIDGKCLFMRLKMCDNVKEIEVEKHLLNLLFNEPKLPALTDELQPDCFAERHKPAFILAGKESWTFPVVWATPNSMNKIIIFKAMFRKYLDTTFPYEDKTDTTPIMVFKYDSTRKSELKVVLEMQESEVVHFGIFERDKPPDAKLIATSIDEYEEKVEEKTGYEAFVCVVKKVGSEAFLTFAGIGPYHVSENPEIAIEESKSYFPDVTLVDDQSDDEEKAEDAEGGNAEAVQPDEQQSTGK